MAEAARDEAVVLRSGGAGGPLGRIRVAAVSPKESAMRERPWRRFDGYAVVLVFGGQGSYRDVNGRDEPIGAGDVIVVTPGFEHWYGPPPGRHWSELFVVFEGAAFDLLAAAGVLTPAAAVLRGRGGADWVERVAGAVAAPAPATPAEAAADVWAFAGLLLELLAAPAPAAQRDPIVHARRLLEADLTAALAMREVAARVGLGYERFRHRFAAEVGVSPARYRDQHRIDAARELLRHTEMRHHQLAAILGFADEYHFSKRFRAAAGVPPGAFRDAARRI
jgi:AraC-like DNA-binding protein